MHHKSELFVAVQRLLPKHWLSRQVARLAESRMIWLKTLLIKRAMHSFDIDLSEADRPKIDEYHSFNDFFTRSLRAGVRPIDPKVDAIVSPADGAISQIGTLDADRILQAKGVHYSAAQLLGDTQHAKNYLNGAFVTVYLSPSNYHRVHIPCEGRLLQTRYIPGELFSVNKLTAQALPGLFSRNERLVCEFASSSIGNFCLIFVGAMLVAGIETVWGGVEFPGQGSMRSQQFHKHDLYFAKGEELARFKFGSTVIMLFQENRCNWLTTVTAEDEVKVGELIATQLNTYAPLDVSPQSLSE